MKRIKRKIIHRLFGQRLIAYRIQETQVNLQIISRRLTAVGKISPSKENISLINDVCGILLHLQMCDFNYIARLKKIYRGNAESIPFLTAYFLPGTNVYRYKRTLWNKFLSLLS